MPAGNFSVPPPKRFVPPNWGVHTPGKKQTEFADKVTEQFVPPPVLKQPSVPAGQKLPYNIDANGIYHPTCKIFTKPVTKGFRDGRRPQFSREYLEHVKSHCLRCGESFCSSQDSRCIYAKSPDSYHFCPTCQRGLHTEASCLANKQVLNIYRR